jgi:CDP-4-dehydro-6-deoxyglucose reductase
MVDSARRDFVQRCALPEAEFYADSFTTQADLADPAQPAAAAPSPR